MAITAHDARMKTYDAIKLDKARQIQLVEELISKAADKCLFELTIKVDLYDETCDYLKKQGFFVSYYNCEYIISWELD